MSIKERASVMAVMAESIAEEKRAALDYFIEAQAEARADGIDDDILAHAAIFLGLSELVDVYGEMAVATLMRDLPRKIEAGDYTLCRIQQ